MSELDERTGIYEALIAVNRGITVIAKAQRNQQQGYMFRGIDDVMNALHPLFCEHGIVIARTDKDIHLEDFQSRKGGVLHMATLTTQWRLIAADGSSVILTAIGQGMDSSDKGINKAASASYKYALLQLFSIPTLEAGNFDADVTTPEAVAQATKKQLERIKEIATDDEITTLVDYYDLGGLEDLSTRQADIALRKLERLARDRLPEEKQAERVQEATEGFVEEHPEK